MIDKLIKLAQENKSNKEIARILGCCAATVARAKRRFGIPDPNARKRAGRKLKFK